MASGASIASPFVATYNADLAALSSLARVALPDQIRFPGMLELRREDGALLDLIPMDTVPEMAAIACRLYDLGFHDGKRAGNTRKGRPVAS